MTHKKILTSTLNKVRKTLENSLIKSGNKSKTKISKNGLQYMIHNSNKISGIY